ncbi:RNA-binding motif protein, X-linked 2-like [Ovis aries]|uniref:RNA-binding motif protein, X-linked 2-like n=1 Tax=Ovis aries TaxID=9940 RepID=UPI0029526408|nr:RNA-binding motif protein, X-linked 2-like [Ovis aries]
MNPLNKVKLINELSEREVQLEVVEKVSWRNEYKDSAWIFLDQRKNYPSGPCIYRLPEDSEEMDEVTRELQGRGCGTRTPPPSSSEGSEDDKPTKKHKKGFSAILGRV